jgi:hypothetical protein
MPRHGKGGASCDVRWLLTWQRICWQVLLSLVLDIKNNKQRSKSNAVSIASVLSGGSLKWLKGCGIEEVQLRNLPWAKVLQPRKKVAPFSLAPCLRRLPVFLNACYMRMPSCSGLHFMAGHSLSCHC